MLEMRHAISNKIKTALYKQEMIFMAGNFVVSESLWSSWRNIALIFCSKWPGRQDFPSEKRRFLPSDSWDLRSVEDRVHGTRHGGQAGCHHGGGRPDDPVGTSRDQTAGIPAQVDVENLAALGHLPV